MLEVRSVDSCHENEGLLDLYQGKYFGLGLVADLLYVLLQCCNILRSILLCFGLASV